MPFDHWQPQCMTQYFTLSDGSRLRFEPSGKAHRSETKFDIVEADTLDALAALLTTSENLDQIGRFAAAADLRCAAKSVQLVIETRFQHKVTREECSGKEWRAIPFVKAIRI